MNSGNAVAWADLTATEQLTRLGEALAADAAELAVATGHGHFELRPSGALALRLPPGATDPLLPLIAQGIDGVDSVGHRSGSADNILFGKFRPLSTKNPATHYNY